MSTAPQPSTALGIVQTSEDGVRIEVVATHGPEAPIAIELRWQTESATLGWITQRRMALAPAEARDLADILRGITATLTAPAPIAQTTPRVVDFAAFRNRAG